MIFGLYLPSSVDIDTPVLFWLSGLTCDDTNFAIKAGSQAFAAAEKEVRICFSFECQQSLAHTSTPSVTRSSRLVRELLLSYPTHPLEMIH